MRAFFTFLMYLIIHFAVAQERLVKGRLTDNSGSPIPGVNITIKGTKTGTISDANGEYAITAPVGSTLVFAFIGMTTREVLVTAASGTQNPNVASRPAHKKTSNTFVDLDSLQKPARGTAILTEKTPTYSGKVPLNANGIRAVRRMGNKYHLKQLPDTHREKSIDIQFTTSLGLETVTKLPPLQTLFAQGRPTDGALQWHGPDESEIFSWGPLLRTLEFDGGEYPFDQHGKLTAAGTGNGTRAIAYQPLSMFRTGYSNTNEFRLSRFNSNGSHFRFVAENQMRRGIIPGTDYNRFNALIGARNFRPHENLKLNSSINYSNATGRLLPRGSNTTSVIGSILRTPVTFDNSNGLSPHSAYSSSKSYQLDNGSMRSHAPLHVENPYAIVNLFPDSERLDRLIGGLDFDYGRRLFSLTGGTTYDDQTSTSDFGTPRDFPGYPDGRLTHRDDRQVTINTSITPSRTFLMDGSTLKVSLGYQNQYTKRELSRKDGFGFHDGDQLSFEYADSLTTRTRSMSRNIHEALFNGLFVYRDIATLRLSTRSYFSNTAKQNPYPWILPGAALKINLEELLQISPRISVFTSISQNIHEAPLLYSDWAYASTISRAENYNSFYETQELIFTPELIPETERKTETGLLLLHQGLEFSMTYYNNVTDDFAIPVLQPDNQFALRNAGTIRNRGVLLKAGFESNWYRGPSWGVTLIWDKHNNEVIDVNDGKDYLPLAGFSEVQSAFAKGQPLGAIYGTSWTRDAEGNQIINESGFPMVNTKLKPIGNPIADWKLSWNGFISSHGAKLSFSFEYKSGGQMYNGTQAALDYLGRSGTTAADRGITNYVFEGVTQSGIVNSKPVTFADPTMPVHENRWVRYGFTGVGEAYIEDASWLRLSDLALSYEFISKHRGSRIDKVMVALVAQNLLLVTPYSGVDPASKLFNYTNGAGLDLFNQPSTRSYSLQISLKI